MILSSAVKRQNLPEAGKNRVFGLKVNPGRIIRLSGLSRKQKVNSEW